MADTDTMRSRLVYVPTVTLGNLLTAGSMLLALAGGLMHLQSQVSETAADLRNLREQVNNDRREVRDALLRIEAKLDGKMDRRAP